MPSKRYFRGAFCAAVLLAAFGCTSNGDDDRGEHGNEAGHAASATNDAGHAGQSATNGGASAAGTAGSTVAEAGAPGVGGEAGSSHSGGGGQAGNGVGGAEGGAAGGADAPCVAPEGLDGMSCPEGYEPLDGYLLDEENGCLTSATVLTCRVGGTGAWWCVVDTEEHIIYYVPEMTCSHTSRFRLGSGAECAGIPDECD